LWAVYSSRYPTGRIRKFLQIFLLNPNFLLVHRYRYSEVMDGERKTPRGHPDFNSYVKILRVFIWNGWMNRQTNRQAEKFIRCGLGKLIGSFRFIAVVSISGPPPPPFCGFPPKFVTGLHPCASGQHNQTLTMAFMRRRQLPSPLLLPSPPLLSLLSLLPSLHPSRSRHRHFFCCLV
jgi:hypothetical protein